MDKQSQVIEIDLLKLCKAYLKRWYLVVAIALIGAIAGFCIAYFGVENTYRASVTIYVNNQSGTSSTEETISQSNLNAAQQLVNTYVNIVKSNTVMRKVADALDNQCDYKELQGYTSAEQVDDTEMFKVYVTTNDPNKSAEIANAIAAVAPGEIASIIDGSSAWIIDTAEVPDHRYNPSYTKWTCVGGLLGLVLIIGILTVESLMDIRIKNVDDLEDLCDIPVIGTIPDLLDADLSKNGQYYYRKSDKGEKEGGAK